MRQTIRHSATERPRETLHTMQTDLDYVVQLLGFGSFLWLGCYVLARSETQAASRLAGLTMLAQACFFFSSALVSRQEGEQTTILTLRLFWWDSVLPAAMWYHLTTRLLGADVELRRRPVILSLYAVAVLGVLAGTATNLLLDSASARPVAFDPRRYEVTAGPLYPFFTLYVLCAASLGFANLLALVRRHLWGNFVFPTSRSDPDVVLVPRATLAQLAHAACY